MRFKRFLHGVPNLLPLKRYMKVRPTEGYGAALHFNIGDNKNG